MVWYSHLLKNIPQFIVIHTVKGFGIVNKAEMDIFLELSCFFDDPANMAIRRSWSVPQSAPGLVFADCIELLHFGCKEYEMSTSRLYIVTLLI